MTCIQLFCDRLDAAPGDHGCELPPGHAETCRCECSPCLTRAGMPALVGGLAGRG